MQKRKFILQAILLSLSLTIIPNYSISAAFAAESKTSPADYSFSITQISDTSTIKSNNHHAGSRTMGNIFLGGKEYYSSSTSPTEFVRRRGWDHFTDTHQCQATSPENASCNSVRRDFYHQSQKINWDTWYLQNHSETATSNVAPVDALPGFTAPEIRGAYSITGSGSGNKVIAIVDAFYYPSALSDLNQYRSLYGSDATPMSACPVNTQGVPQFPSSGTGCFSQVNQQGVANNFASSDSGWNGEEALDIDMATGVCPSCSILLIGSNSSGLLDLNTGVGAALNFPGVVAISNSYGISDYSETNLAYYATDNFSAAATKGIGVFASTGDNGYGVQAPAAFDSVVGVGGTSLTIDATSHRKTESAWSGAGSGCSTLNAKPSWQNISTSICSDKVVADISAVADPNTGVLIVHSGVSQVVGGTSASSPIIASIFAIANSDSVNTSHIYAASRIWSSPKSFYDVASGSNGSCSVASLCTAATGWDGPSGLGTPIGLLGLIGAQANAAIPINLTYSGTGFTYGHNGSLLLTSTIAGGEGFITFYYNGKKMFHCSHVATTNYVATCNWIPTARGTVVITTQGVSGNSSYASAISSPIYLNITRRTLTRGQ